MRRSCHTASRLFSLFLLWSSYFSFLFASVVLVRKRNTARTTCRRRLASDEPLVLFACASFWARAARGSPFIADFGAAASFCIQPHLDLGGVYWKRLYLLRDCDGLWLTSHGYLARDICHDPDAIRLAFVRRPSKSPKKDYCFPMPALFGNI